MRTIKFRGRTENREWLYGNFLFLNGKPQIVSFAGLFHWDVDKKTVGQFTGLKDKSGVCIYEGDIFLYNRHADYFMNDFKAIVQYDESRACFGYVEIESTTKFITPFCRHDELEKDILLHVDVIGNIHDTPENQTYSICDKNEKMGFIIPSPYRDDEYTPMRAIKYRIKELIKLMPFGRNSSGA